ncbi:MAG TPA: hypothetical protein ENO01_03350 [Candidatus Marinimicrobia bacterium]|nr:hypothetical protein [Candidatus Neomarinimicrobiota bacterium]
MFWNVENLFDTINDPDKEDDEFSPGSFLRWNDRVYRFKLEQLSRIIRKEKPILIGLAEIENRQVLEDLTATFKNSDLWGIIHRESEDRRGIDTALLYRKDILDTLYVSHYEPSLPSGSVTRGFLICEFTFNSGESFVVTVVHFPSKRGSSRDAEIDRLACARQLVTVLRNEFPGTKCLIMGDFNAGPHEEPMKILNVFYYPLISEENGWTYVYRGIKEQLDHFLVNGEFFTGNPRINPSSGKVIRSSEMSGEFGFPEPFILNRRVYGGFSDHFPIAVFLTIQ